MYYPEAEGPCCSIVDVTCGCKFGCRKGWQLSLPIINCRALTESLIKASNEHMNNHVSSSRGGSYIPAAAAALAPPGTPTAGQLALSAVSGTSAGHYGMQQGQQQQQHAVQDDLSSLLETLAAVFKVRPGLWFDGEAPEAYGYVSSFMSYVSWCNC